MNFCRYPVLAAVILLSVSASSIAARAADIEAPAADLWTGFYLGAQAGYLWGTGSNSDVCDSVTGEGSLCFSDQTDQYDIGGSNSDGITVGGYLGYNYRIDSFVMGLEGDFNWDNAEGRNSILGGLNYNTSLNWDAAIRARLGVILNERALLYVTGGPSWLSTALDTNLGITPASLVNYNTGDSSTEFGWVVGAGTEYFVSDQLSIKAEYLHGWYNDADLNFATASDGVSTYKTYLKQDLQTNVVRAGIAYHFGSF